MIVHFTKSNLLFTDFFFFKLTCLLKTNFIIYWVGISKNCTDFVVIDNRYIHRIKSLWLNGIANSVFLIMYTFGWQMALG